jgi:hypothetical protein
MNLDNVLIFILPLCDFSDEESQNLSLDELDRLWKQDRITKYKLENFLKDVNDDMLVDNTNNWIVIREENRKQSKILRNQVSNAI